MHIAEQGSGPLVVLLHGFPECWYSWRHQLAALSEAGFHAVAPDQRGYGRTDRPEATGRYTILHLVGDVIGLLDALNEERAVVVGHDWGAPVAWHTAMMRPDRVRGVVGLSVPYRPRGTAPPLRVLREALGAGFYQIYFQEPGVADAELAWNVRSTFRRLLYSGSGDAALDGRPLRPIVPRGRGFLDIMTEPE
jgi:pimeloyl-ACP methyl ester carboxylesterase